MRDLSKGLPPDYTEEEFRAYSMRAYEREVAERRPTALRGLAYELDGVLADFSEDPKAAPDAVCIGTIERVRDKLRELAASPKAWESRTEDQHD